jgi:hypothetical protein
MRRREFITLVGGVAATWPLAVRAQQPAMPVIGVLGSASAQFKDALTAGLKESGYTDGQNVRMEYRWAEGDYDRLPAMADELVSLRINVLCVLGTAAARSAKAASLKVSPPMPVVFAFGGDPVATGLVASFNRPGGNITGSTSIAGSLAPKRLELLRAFVRDRCRVRGAPATPYRCARYPVRYVLSGTDALDGGAGGLARGAGYRPIAGVRRRRRPDDLRTQYCRRGPAGRGLCRQGP